MVVGSLNNQNLIKNNLFLYLKFFVICVLKKVNARKKSYNNVLLPAWFYVWICTVCWLHCSSSASSGSSSPCSRPSCRQFKTSGLTFTFTYTDPVRFPFFETLRPGTAFSKLVGSRKYANPDPTSPNKNKYIISFSLIFFCNANLCRK